MLLTLGIGLLVAFGLCLALSLAFFALDEEPQEQNLRALRQRSEAAVAPHGHLDDRAYDDLHAAA